jgi:hypothetical protein
MIIAGGLKAMGPGAIVMPAFVVVLAAVLLWFSWFAQGRNWFGQSSPTEAEQ